jgi:hypothetical protein
MATGVQIIDPSTGASQYGANFAQWDWKPFSDGMNAAKTTYGMMKGNQEESRKQAEEAREQEEFELEKILFPTKKKAAELSLIKLQSEINENNANAERLKGMYDSRSLTGSDYAAAMFKERFPEYYNSPIFAGGSARPVAPSNSSNSSNPSSLNSTSNFLNW